MSERKEVETCDACAIASFQSGIIEVFATRSSGESLVDLCVPKGAFLRKRGFKTLKGGTLAMGVHYGPSKVAHIILYCEPGEPTRKALNGLNVSSKYLIGVQNLTNEKGD